MNFIVWAAIGGMVVTIGLVTLIVLRPDLTADWGGKILAFIAFFILPVAGVGITNLFHLEQSKKTEFCLSCHTMKPYGQSLYIDNSAYIPAKHFQNRLVPDDKACFTCHTSYTMFGGIQAKLRGLKHVFVYFLGKPPAVGKIKPYVLYENRECLYCHARARSFEKNVVHAAVRQDIASNKLSCIGCHNQLHEVARLDQFMFWKPVEESK